MNNSESTSSESKTFSNGESLGAKLVADTTAQVEEAKRSALAMVGKAESYVRENPWRAFGLAVLGGFVAKEAICRIPEGALSLGTAVSLAKALSSASSLVGTSFPFGDTSVN